MKWDCAGKCRVFAGIAAKGWHIAQNSTPPAKFRYNDDNNSVAEKFLFVNHKFFTTAILCCFVNLVQHFPCRIQKCLSSSRADDILPYRHAPNRTQYPLVGAATCRPHISSVILRGAAGFLWRANTVRPYKTPSSLPCKGRWIFAAGKKTEGFPSSLLILYPPLPPRRQSRWLP